MGYFMQDSSAKRYLLPPPSTCLLHRVTMCVLLGIWAAMLLAPLWLL